MKGFEKNGDKQLHGQRTGPLMAPYVSQSINDWTHTRTPQNDKNIKCTVLFFYCTNRTCFQLTWWNAVLGSGGKEIVNQKPYYVYKMPKSNQWENLNTMVSIDGLWSKKEIQFVSSQTRKRIKNFNTWNWILDSGSVHNRDVIHKRENWTKVVPQVDIVFFFFLWI